MSTARRRPAGTIPAAFSRTGEDVPPSPDVAEHNLAQLIGQSVAVHVAQLLAPAVQQLAQAQAQPACVLCVQACKQAEQDWRTAVQNARQAAEPEPEFTAPPISAAVTWMPLGTPPVAVPVCYQHVPDGPGARPTGLVAPDGRQIVAKA